MGDSLLFQTDRIVVRPTTTDDLRELRGLWNDGRVMRWAGFPDGMGYTDAGIAEWFEKVQANPRRHHYIVRAHDVGFCGELYYSVDVERRLASLDIKFRPEAQGGGRSADALMGLIHHIFRHEPEVDAVWTEPGDANLAAWTLYWRCGLRPTARPPGLRPGPSYWERARSDRNGRP